MRDDLRALRGVVDVRRHVGAGDGYAGLANSVGAADVVGVRPGIDDVLNGFVGQLADRRQNFIRILRAARIDYHHAQVADLHGNVSARARDHVNVPLDVQYIQGSELSPSNAEAANAANTASRFIAFPWPPWPPSVV